MKNELHWGLDMIAARLGVNKHKAREWCEKEIIPAYREGGKPHGRWYSIESEINEAINQLPGRLSNEKT